MNRTQLNKNHSVLTALRKQSDNLRSREHASAGTEDTFVSNFSRNMANRNVHNNSTAEGRA